MHIAQTFYRRFFSIGTFAGASLFCASAFAFAPGNLVVTRAVGTGFDSGGAPANGALLGNGVGATVYLDEYTPAGVFVGSVVMPNVRNAGAGNKALVFSGTQNGEGAITLSGNGQYLLLTGYNQTAYRTDLTGANGTNAAASNVIERVVGRVDLNGNVDTTTALTDVSSAQSFRSAFSTDGTDIWVQGQNGGNPTGTDPTGGILHTTLGSSTANQIFATNQGNSRVLNGFGGQLYVSNTGNNPNRGVAAVGTGFPTTAGQTLTNLPGFPTASSTETTDDFWFKDASTLYTADNRNDTNGGIRKFLLTDHDADLGTPDQWVFQYNVTLGTQQGPTTGNNVGAHGITGVIDATGQAVIFATTFDGSGSNRNNLVRLIDDGTPAGFAASLQVLATSPDLVTGAGSFATAFRGVEIVPEPSVLSLLGVGVLGLLRRRTQ
jgi:hypothetical protein